MINTAKKAGDGLTINGGGLWLANTHPDVIEYLANSGIVEDEFTLDEVKDQRCDIMLQAFNQAVAEDVTYNSVIYQSGENTRESLVLAISNFISAANALPVGFEWVAKDNTEVSFTTTNIKEFAGVVGDQYAAAWANFQTRKNQIRAVSTGDDAADIITVNAIGW